MPRNEKKSPNPKALSIGKRIRGAYTKAGFNRSQFVREMDVAYMSAFRWEKGEAVPGGENLAKIAALTEVSVAWLLGEEEAGGPDSGGKSFPALAADTLKAIQNYIASPYAKGLTSRDKQLLHGFAWHALGSKPPDLIEIHQMLEILRRREAGEDDRPDLANPHGRGGRQLDP